MIATEEIVFRKEHTPEGKAHEQKNDLEACWETSWLSSTCISGQQSHTLQYGICPYITIVRFHLFGDLVKLQHQKMTR
jgi:hypothetical protein